VNLFRTELVRFWSRRITWVTLGLAALVMIVAITFAFFRTDAVVPDNAGGGINGACMTGMMTDIREGNTGFPPEMTEAEMIDIARTQICVNRENNDRRFWAVSILGPESSDYSENRRFFEPFAAEGEDPMIDVIGRDGVRREYRESREPLTGVVPAVSIVFLLIAVILGASFMGAEYRSGTVENLLLWEPRRARVLITKYVAGFLSSAVATAAALGFLTGLLLLLASVHGTYEGVDGRFWIDLVSVLLRASLAGGLMFVMAMAIATIFKHTTAAVGAILGWFVASNIVVETLLRSLRQHELVINAAAFVGEGEPFRYVETTWGHEPVYHHGYLAAGVYVFVWAAIPALIALVIFTRRDLT